VRTRVRTPDLASEVFFLARPDKSRADVTFPVLKENMEGQRFRNDRRAHPWDERRTEVIQKWSLRVIRAVTPIGYVEPMGERAEVWDLSTTQCLVHKDEHRMTRDCVPADIAPEYAMLAANGVKASSMNAEDYDEDGGALPMAEAIAEFKAAEAVRSTLDARTETFLREHDRRMWYSGRPKVAYAVVDSDDRRGLAPKAGHPWTSEQLRESMHTTPLPAPEAIRTAAKRRADPAWPRIRKARGVEVLQSPAERTNVRIDKEMSRFIEGLMTPDEGIADADKQRYDAQPDSRDYPAGETCPSCTDGKVYDEEAGLEEPCSMCQGSAQVLSVLGCDGIAVSDIDESMYVPKEDHEPASLRFVDLITSRAAKRFA